MTSTISTITPTNNPNQRNIKIDNQTSDIVLVNQQGVIYINSSSESHLREIASRIGIENPEYINIQGRERQYGGITGYLLKTEYKNITGAIHSIKALLRKNAELNAILHKKAA